MSSNEEYCRKWIGNIDSQEEFEISTCECNDDNDDQQPLLLHYCPSWTCYEAGYDYFYPNYIWVLLPILICGSCFTFCFVCTDNNNNNNDRTGSCCQVIALLLTFVGLTYAVALLAGLVAVLIVVGTLWVLFPLIYCATMLYKKKRRDNKNNNKIKNSNIQPNNIDNDYEDDHVWSSPEPESAPDDREVPSSLPEAMAVFLNSSAHVTGESAVTNMTSTATVASIPMVEAIPVDSTKSLSKSS